MTGHASENRVVYAVEWGNEHPAEVDSLWETREAAERRADELGDMWRVREWTVRRDD